jgi:hypothetical protein
MSYQLSACVFIRDTFRGAFCLFEGMASLLHLADEFIVLDLGSTDGTLEALLDIERHNPRVQVAAGTWPVIDASAFATLANDLVAMCRFPRVLYYQADEIWHEDLVERMEQRFRDNEFDLSFWRIQYRDNWQLVKWFPHLVHRVGYKGKFNFTGDGMTTDRTWDAKICSQYDGSWFQRWGVLHQDGIKPYVGDMIMDVSLVGGFRDNIIERRALHAPFWHEEPTVEGKPAGQWAAEAMANPAWTRPESPYNLPAIMRWHLGRTRYELRPELLEALKRDRTAEYIRGLR